MTHTALSPLTATPVLVEEENGRIRSVTKAPDASTDLWIAPGLIDIQVNGFAGVDYNTPHTPLEDIARSIREMRATGVTRFCPTVITGSNENIRGSLQNLSRARRELPEGPSMCGFHVEGPWISPIDGPRGAHPKEHVRAPSIDEFEQFQEAAEGNIRLLTLAPEAEGSLPVIEQLVERGIVVAIGHTNANRQQIRDAIRAGATMSTHLGNGSHAEVPRHDNYIIHQMAADELRASFIVDGIHLTPEFVKVGIRAKGLERSILTTDAVPPAGCPPGIYRFGHLEVELTAEMRVELTDSRRLAGSALRMDRALSNLMRFAGLPLPDALKTGTSNAARGIELEGRKGFLQLGDVADFILFRFDPETKAIEIEKTIVSSAELS
jgi:N-acetylglucosamine-6-phosphate deacetylase